ncbi:MAG: TerC family protein, partial [Kiloniellales bacterium]
MEWIDGLFEFDLQAFVSVIIIDLVMSGDNAIIIGLAAAGLAPHLKRRAIFYGIVGATVLRVLFASITYQLLSVIGLLLAGGILLLWVAYKMWREIR